MHALPQAAPPAPEDPRAVTILARSLYREMRDQGFANDQVIALSAELLELLRDDLRRQQVAQ